MTRQKILSLLLIQHCLLIIPSLADALKLEKNQPVKVDFYFPQWNKNPAIVDTAVLLFRDANSGKIANIYLEETGPNTGKFTGSFNISFVGDSDVIPEIYMPPQSMAKSSGHTLESLIKEGRLVRKPYFLRKENNQQLLSVYNTKQQAVEAYDKFRNNIKGQPLIDKAALAAQHTADKAAEEARLAKLAFAQEMMRKQLEEDEKRKQEELKKQQESLAAEERQRRKDLAQKIAQEALALYKKENYPEAEKKFHEAMELDPSNQKYNFQYGVTLFKNEKTNEALVALKLANDPSVNPAEKAYFMGLAYMKMKEYESAKEQFEIVFKGNDKQMGPMAAFLIGLINFTQEKYNDAKPRFQYVIDNSSDPKLDAQAENYMDQIANIEQFEEKKKNRFTLNLTLGEQYDSNVLLMPDSTPTSASATNKAGLRSLALATLEYRAIITEKHELSVNLGYTDMFTVTTSLKPDATLQQADPLVFDYKLPYKYKGSLFGKGYQLTLTPGYETINLNADGVGARELIMKSTIFSTAQTFIVSDSYFTTVNIDYQKDDNVMPEPTGTDADATKTAISNNNIWFRDQKKTEAILANFGYTLYNAVGNDYKYNKTDLSAGYLSPLKSTSSLTYLLAYSLSDYPKHSLSRKDSNTSFTVAYSKPFKDNLKGGLAGNYTLNGSNLDSYKYNKWTLTATLNWTTNF